MKIPWKNSFVFHAAVLAACCVSAVAGCTLIEGNEVKASNMCSDGSNIAPDELIGTWVHSHEEDPQDGSLREVYRPGDWAFGPSRGRRGYDLQRSNLASIQEIAPADGVRETEAGWWLEPGGVLIIRESGGATRRMCVESVSPDRLVLREMLDAT